MDSEFFCYGDKEVEFLMKKDKKLARAIEKIGKINRKKTPDLFTALVESVIGQQISSKAADTVFRRLTEICEITPKNICELDLAEIQSCGMSFKKAEYVKGVAEAANSGAIDLEKFKEMTDDEVIKTLSAIKGVGVWTAEMMLIFSLNRPNVFSYGDLAIRRGIMNLYGHKEVTKPLFEKYRKRYSPYASTASLYLWELAVRPLE